MTETNSMKINTKWLPLFSTNFLGVLNDNFLKNLVCFIGVLWMAKENESLVVMIASAMLVIPYLFFSPLAGRLAKTHNKKTVVVWAKFAEMPIMIMAVIGFYTESIYVVMAAIFFMGLQSALYSPSKYGLIRDVDGTKGISFGTGSMEMLTFAGVLLGTFLATVISDHYNLLYLSVILIVLAVLGWISSVKIRVNESKTIENCTDTVNPIKFFKESFLWAKKLKDLNYVVLGLSFFWLIGSLLQMNLIVHCPKTLGMTNTQTGFVMSAAAIGIGLGCYLAGVISKSKVNLGLVPIGGIGMSIFLTIIYFAQPTGIVFAIMIFFTALFSGFYKVPLNAWIQEKVEGRKLGDMLAYTNLSVFSSILISAGIFGFLETTFNTNAIFLAILAFTIVISILLPLKNTDMRKQFKSMFNKN